MLLAECGRKLVFNLKTNEQTSMFNDLDADNFCKDILNTIEIAEFCEVVGSTYEDASNELKTAVAEARQTLSLIQKWNLKPNSKILEVGSGIGIASSALAFFGYEVTALEPGGIGFEKNQKASQFISSQIGTTFTCRSEAAERIDFPEDVKFELIFSNNVLEHVTDVESALKNLFQHLSKSGVMIHSCPNYSFPFEPHFGIPLVPVFPRITRAFLGKHKRESGLWKSLNFVTARRVRRYAKHHGFSVAFRKGTMLKSFSRLREDSEFLSRHQTLGKLTNNKILYGLLTRVFRLPILIATPMDFIICHDSQKDSDLVLNWLRER
jgi:2-polyprenyl-3-methyl-5-hydroxy-6-metoxy-1,4-benzoquinol methylase